MKERYHETLARVIARIEDALPGVVHLDELSAEAGLSKYHLHRVFRALTGYPLAEYARLRRLSVSLSELLSTDHSILRIALDCGFGHEQSYIRAFKSHWGVGPGEYRSKKLLLQITPPLSADSLISVGADSALASPSLVVRPSLYLYGIRRFITDDENKEFNTVADTARVFVDTVLPSICYPLYADRYFGFIEHCGNPNDNWYMNAAELKRPLVSPSHEGFTYRSIPGRVYHEFLLVARTHPGNLLWTDVESLYAIIFGGWLAENRSRVEPGWHLEFVDLSVAKADYCEFRILIPAADELLS